jgi:hypothetical protein
MHAGLLPASIRSRADMIVRLFGVFHEGSGRHPLTTLFVLITLLAAASCQHVFPRADELSRTDWTTEPFESVLVGSVVQPDLDRRDTQVIFWFRSADGRHRFRIQNQPGAERTNTADSGPEQFNGKLFAVPASAGVYELVGFTMHSYTWFRTELDPPLRFLLERNEVLYIGSLEMRPCYSAYTRPDGATVPQTDVGAIPAIRDRHERDIPLLKHSYVNLLDREISVRVLPQDQVLSQSARSRRSCDYDGHVLD